MHKKQLYAAPATEVLELHLEGVIAASGDPIFGGSGLGDDSDGSEHDL